MHAGTVQLYTRYEMLDLVIIDGRARGIIARNLVTGEIERYAAHAVVIGTGGLMVTLTSSLPTLWAVTASAAIGLLPQGCCLC